jgi:hypothetical protein
MKVTLFRRLVAAALIVIGGVAAALALNLDQTRNFPARALSTQQTHFYRIVVNFNDPNIATAQKFGTLPAVSFITNVFVEVATAFNAGTTNTLTIGTTTAANEIVATGDLTGNGTSSLSTQVSRVTRGFGRGLTAAGDTLLYAKYTQTGTAATTGQAYVVIEYVPKDNEL